MGVSHLSMAKKNSTHSHEKISSNNCQIINVNKVVIVEMNGKNCMIISSASVQHTKLFKNRYQIADL